MVQLVQRKSVDGRTVPTRLRFSLDVLIGDLSPVRDVPILTALMVDI